MSSRRRLALTANWTAALAFTVLFASGCATPVGVKRLDEQAAHRELNANILSSAKPSDYSTQILERSALTERFKSDPPTVLAELNSGLGKPDERDRLFALSELSFAYAEDSGNQSYYLASAAYAYAFLFPTNPADAPGPYDPRLTLAVDLYNRGIAQGLETKDGKEVDLRECQLSLPFGSLSLSDELEGFTYGGSRLTKFVSLADLKVRGLRNTYRTPGIGAVLSARVEPTPGSPASRWIPATAKVPITAFVRFDNPRLAMSNGHLRSTVELYDDDRTVAVQSAHVLADIGRTDEARSELGRCREIMAAGEEWRGLAGLVEWSEAAIAVAEKRLDDADRHFASAIEIIRHYSMRTHEGPALCEWGRVLLAAGHRDRALEKFDEALELFRRVGAGQPWIDRVLADKQAGSL